MEWNRKDPDGWALMACSALGFKIDAMSLEMILNAYELSKNKKGEVVLSDISELRFSIHGLFGIEVDSKGDPITAPV